MQHKNLFVLSAIYSGSTLLTALLGTSPNVSILKAAEHEGIKLPGVRGLFAGVGGFRNKPLPWGFLDRIYRQHWDLSRPILVEKGPYMRYAQTIEDFYPDVHFIIPVRNPYAWCESMRRRHQPKPGVLQPSMQDYALRWLMQTSWQIHNLATLRHTVWLNYEELCDRTLDALKKLYAFMPELEPMDPGREFRVHSTLGKASNPITNTNERSIARLNAGDIGDITMVLSRHPDVTDYFGYSLID